MTSATAVIHSSSNSTHELNSGVQQAGTSSHNAGKKMNRRSKVFGEDGQCIVRPVDGGDELNLEAKFGDPWVRHEVIPREKQNKHDCPYAPQCDDSLLEEGDDEVADFPADIRVYKRRYWILFVFSLLAFCQYCAWNTFGPIATTLKLVFDWSNTEIAILASMDPITYLLTMLLFSWLMDTKGLRLSVLISAGFMFVGTGLRCVPSNSTYAFWPICAGQLLNGLAGPVTQAAPTLLSAAWFPTKQRTTATAVAALCGCLGVAISFVIGPLFIRDIQSDFDALMPAKANYSANLSLVLDRYNDKTLPFTDSIYMDAVHYWPLDKLNVTLQDLNNDGSRSQSSKDNKLWRTETVNTLRDLKGGKEGQAFGNVLNSEGVINKSIVTDGQNGWANLGHFTNSCLAETSFCQDGFTVSLWIKYQRSNRSLLYYLGTSGSREGYRGFLIFQDFGYDSQDHLALKVENGTMLWKRSFDVQRDAWTHVIFTWDAHAGLEIYTNGSLAVRDSLGQKTRHLTHYTSMLTLGRPNDQLIFSKATYDEIVVWYRKLHPAEIKAIHERTDSFDERINIHKEKERLIAESKKEIMMLLYIEFGVVALLFLVVVYYFPDKPPVPPSKSARVHREDFAEGARQILRNKQFWTLGLVYGVTTGVYSGWGASLAVNLAAFNIGQSEAGWIGFYATLAGIGSGLLLARCADLFGGRMKALLLLLFFGSASCFLWFSLLCLRMIPFDNGALYKSSILGGFFVSGTIPLFYELTVESTYPVAEGVTTGILTLLNNAFTVAFLIILTIPSLGTVWMNWCMFAACAGCIPIMLAFRENYRRLNIDKAEPITDSDPSNSEVAKGPANNPEKKLKSPMGSFLSFSQTDDLVNRLQKSKESHI